MGDNMQRLKRKRKLMKGFVELCKEEFGNRLESVVLFGSRARGSASSKSDWDFFLVVKNLPERRIDRYKLFQSIKRKIYHKFKERVQVEAYTPSEASAIPPNPLVYSVLTGYQVLYGEEYWDEVVEFLKPEIKKRNPILHQEDKEWRIAEMV